MSHDALTKAQKKSSRPVVNLSRLLDICQAHPKLPSKASSVGVALIYFSGLVMRGEHRFAASSVANALIVAGRDKNVHAIVFRLGTGAPVLPSCPLANMTCKIREEAIPLHPTRS